MQTGDRNAHPGALHASLPAGEAPQDQQRQRTDAGEADPTKAEEDRLGIRADPLDDPPDRKERNPGESDRNAQKEQGDAGPQIESRGGSGPVPPSAPPPNPRRRDPVEHQEQRPQPPGGGEPESLPAHHRGQDPVGDDDLGPAEQQRQTEDPILEEQPTQFLNLPS